MLADSQIKLVQQSPGYFVAYDPPYVLFGSLFILFGLVFAVTMTVLSVKMGWRNVNLVGFGAAAVFLFMGASTAATSGHISGSVESGEIAVRKQVFGLTVEGKHVPLEDIQFARVQDVKNAHRVILVLRSGKTVALTSATDRDGYDQLARAINQLLVH